MVTPWKREKELAGRTDPRLIDLMKELVEIANENLKDRITDDVVGKKTAYLEYKGERRHRIFEFIDIKQSKDEETKKRFLVRGIFAGIMEIGEDGVPLDVCYDIRIPNLPHLVAEGTMFENRDLELANLEGVVSDMRNSYKITRETYLKYANKAIERIVSRRQAQ